METHRIPINDTESIVVDWQPPQGGAGARCAVWVHGLASDRKGEKALYFAERLRAKGWGYLALDMRGHGESDGALRDLTLTRCLEDLAAALAWMARQSPAGAKPLLIGSSMGAAVIAWHHMAQPRETAELVMIAPALTFPASLSWQLGPKALEAWRASGSHRFESDWIDLEIGFSLIDDGLTYDPQRLIRAYAAPTLLLHGMQDDSVDWRGSLTFVEDCPFPRLDLLLIKGGDHRLTSQKELLFDTMWGWLGQE